MTLLEPHNLDSRYQDLMNACSGLARRSSQRSPTDTATRGAWTGKVGEARSPRPLPGVTRPPGHSRGHRPGNGLIVGAGVRPARGRRASPGAGEKRGVAGGRLLALRTAPPSRRPPEAEQQRPSAAAGGSGPSASPPSLRLPSPGSPAHARTRKLKALPRHPERQKPLLGGLLRLLLLLLLPR